MNFEIKKFDELNVDEMYEIAKSRFEVFVCEQKIVEEQDFDDKDKKCYHIMLKEDRRIVAYSRIVPKNIGYDYVSVGRVLVLSSHRRKGIAQKMMKVALDFIKNNLDENIVVLSGQLYAKGLYESVGFKVISDIYDEVNIPHVKMKVEL
ncbi:GNAT family N-acetyltransferase [Clostridium sp. D53t1_180928_C8]|uniref:GNAT family N-acetyltransferase n=1 Tax=Clostridium sp. D53t1_180928_C8 TaxID=2787101 RepID=UPI0018AA6516|nr:GNAT family N-acetyltransferase [Clostridium sp. D53t1_180928_C8]